MKRIKILGAGLSGLSAAINLAKVGYQVDVFERNKGVGERFNGDLQGLENWSEKKDVLEELKGINIKINFDCSPFSKLMIINGSKTEELKFKKPLFYLVKRGSVSGSLEEGLKKQARELGVNIFFKKTIPESKADIVATGPIASKIFVMAKGMIFKTKMKDIAVGLSNNRATFRGYSYLLIAQGYGCLATVLFGKFSTINSCFEETKNIFSKIMKFDNREPKKFGGIGSFSIKNIFQKGSTLFVGEAAGLQDCLWGFGIRYALQSGFIAAQSIVNNQDYGEIAKKHFSHKLKASLVNRFLWEKLSFNNYSFMIDRIKNARHPFKALYSLNNYNHLQKLIYPVAWLHMRKKNTLN